MRSPALLLSIGLSLAPAIVFADDFSNCHVTAGPHDRVAKDHDVEVAANETVESVVAVNGNVVVRKGAHVKNAVALHGSVTIEPGALVDESVVVFGGRANVDSSAKVNGSVVSLGKGLHVRGEDGKSFDLDVSIDGESLAKNLLEKVLKDLDRCVVVPEPTKT
jgi:NDP-sugar pyrophosphorylase family protein